MVRAQVEIPRCVEEGRVEVVTKSVRKLSPRLAAVKYDVQGPVFTRLVQIVEELTQGVQKPFSEVIRTHVGDGQASSNPPLTFLRQVVATLLYPPLIQLDVFPSDVKARVEHILQDCRGNSIGASTPTLGLECVRENVVKYLETRDSGVKADIRDIVLTNGTATIIRMMVSHMSDEIDGKKPAILLPTPEYPLFSASLQEHGVQELRYKLNEDDVWAIDIDSAYEAVEEGKRQSYQPRAIVIINPGNPTGQVMSVDEIKSVIKLAYKENLMILSDEVYQELAYFDDHPFHSFKKVLKEMGHPYSDSVQLCSFMSSSKGVIYESGLRGGFMEMTNVDDSIRKCLTTVCSAQLCANTIGQVAVDVMVKPPVPGEPSYQLYNEEKTIAMDALKRKSKACCDFFNSLEGVHCNPIRSGYYAFPRVDIPPRAVKDAEAKGMDVDTYYLMELLEETGISYAPGSAFGQAPGTHHLRVSFLPPDETLNKMMTAFKRFHEGFRARYYP